MTLSVLLMDVFSWLIRVIVALPGPTAVRTALWLGFEEIVATEALSTDQRTSSCDVDVGV